MLLEKFCSDFCKDNRKFVSIIFSEDKIKGLEEGMLQKHCLQKLEAFKMQMLGRACLSNETCQKNYIKFIKFFSLKGTHGDNYLTALDTW